MICMSFWAMCSGTAYSYGFGKLLALIAGMYGGLALRYDERFPRR